VYISQNFDAGNIEVISCDQANNIQLKIRPDHQSEFYQWFYFRLSGAKNTQCKMHFLNAGGAAYPGGFENYRICYSYDRSSWLRHPTSLKDEVMTVEFTPEYDSVYFAYFIPYSMERHADLIAKSLQSPLCSHQILGQTLDGQDLDLLKFSSDAVPDEKPNCWITARQHPGESMGQWWMEGCIEHLISEQPVMAKSLLSKCNLYLVPNMNPDGSRRGHLRTNAAGRNLNREWEKSKLNASPEVFHVKQAMKDIGVSFLLDIHGDETFERAIQLFG